MPSDKTSAEYLAIGEKIKTAEFRGVVVTQLKYIEKSLGSLKKTDKEQGDKIEDLEKFQANMVGKFTVIGVVVITLVNWAWDIGSDFIKSVK